MQNYKYLRECRTTGKIKLDWHQDAVSYWTHAEIGHHVRRCQQQGHPCSPIRRRHTDADRVCGVDIRSFELSYASQPCPEWCLWPRITPSPLLANETPQLHQTPLAMSMQPALTGLSALACLSYSRYVLIGAGRKPWKQGPASPYQIRTSSPKNMSPCMAPTQLQQRPEEKGTVFLSPFINAYGALPLLTPESSFLPVQSPATLHPPPRLAELLSASPAIPEAAGSPRSPVSPPVNPNLRRHGSSRAVRSTNHRAWDADPAHRPHPFPSEWTRRRTSFPA